MDDKAGRGTYVCLDCRGEKKNPRAQRCKGCSVRERQTGRPHPHKMPPMKESTKIKISIAHTGKSMPEEMKKKMSVINAGSGNPMFGHKHSPETIEKLRKASSGKSPGKETREKMSICRLGEKSHFWKGGIAREGYGIDFRNYLKRKIRERDNYICQNPGCHLPENGRLHDCHHIDYNKKNNDPNNLITLCVCHHSQTSAGDHRYWTDYYQDLQELRRAKS